MPSTANPSDGKRIKDALARVAEIPMMQQLKYQQYCGGKRAPERQQSYGALLAVFPPGLPRLYADAAVCSLPNGLAASKPLVAIVHKTFWPKSRPQRLYFRV